MNHFCTLFDSFYLTRGLALYESLRRHEKSFTLYVFCFDEQAYSVLSALAPPSLVPISLAEFETPELLRVKQTRTRGEYCWTSTSHTIRHVLDHYKVPEVTYLDADVYFFCSPAVLLDEWRTANASVLITEHRYTPEYDLSAQSGIYCVQFTTFRSDERARKALQWWQDRCIEWCYARVEDGRFGDQKYLDDWTTRFEGVHVLRHLGGGVAPWNVQQYSVKKDSLGVSVNGYPLVFFHYHSLKWRTDRRFDISTYRLNDDVEQLIYRPYVAELEASLRKARQVEPSFDRGKVPPPRGTREFMNEVRRRWLGTSRTIREL